MKHNILKVLKEQKEMKLKGNIYHLTQTKFSYNSNHIEGSTLTEEQTAYIYETNSLINKGDFTKVDDIIETTNHFKLFDYMLDTIEEPLNQELILEFHKILKTGTSDDREKEWFVVGGYKKLENFVGDINTSSPKDVKMDIEDLLKDYNSKNKITINEIADFHVKFERIHPFQDGNGRIGRMIMFRESLKHNVLPFIIDEKNRDFYYRGLKNYDEDKNWLLDTIGSSQDEFEKLCNELLKGWTE